MKNAAVESSHAEQFRYSLSNQVPSLTDRPGNGEENSRTDCAVASACA